HHVDDAAHARTNAGLLETQRFACLVGNYRNAVRFRHFTQRAIAQHRVEHQWHAEGARDLGGFVAGEIGTNLRHVGAVHGAGVQVDGVGAQIEHLGLEQVRHACAKAAGFRAGKAAVQVATVRQVTGLVNKTEHVDHRHRDQGTGKIAQAADLQQAANDFHAVELVAVDRGADQQHRPGLLAMHHMHGNIQRRVGVELRGGHFHHGALARRNAGAGQLERCHATHPRAPLVAVRCGRALFSMNLMIMLATSFDVAVSIPSRPGEEFTSITSGPWLERRISTPATFRPMMRAARTAVARSSGVMRISDAVPPRCRLERNSPSFAWRFMAATTLPSTTKQRISAPPASLMYSCTMMFADRPINASITDSAALRVSASTTPIPWVPSSSLITSGAPPTMLIRSGISSGALAKPVTGRPTPLRASNCNERNLSRARVMATDS